MNASGVMRQYFALKKINQCISSTIEKIKEVEKILIWNEIASSNMSFLILEPA